MAEEFNETRAREIEIPLMQLEQRVLLLEGQHQSQVVDKIEFMTQEISQRISRDLKRYLPSVDSKLEKME